MSFFLLDLPEGSFAGVSGGVLKARDRAEFTAAAALLDEARILAARQAEEMEAASLRGYQAAHAEAQDALSAAITENAENFARQLAEIERRYTATVAEAALAAASSIIGELPAEQVTGRIAEKLLQAHGGEGKPVLQVSPANAALLADKFDSDAVSIVADPALGNTDCRLLDGERTFVADLSVQISAIAEKWGAAGVMNPQGEAQ